MKSKNVVIAVAALLVVVAAVLFYGHHTRLRDDLTPQSLYDFDPNKCPGKTYRLKMADLYMRGLLEFGEEFKASMNWYKCNQPVVGDMVLYRFSGSTMPVVRRIVAVAEDLIAVKHEKAAGYWILLVNDQMVKSETGTPYFFGGSAEPPLKLYEKTHGGKISAGEAVVFSSFPPGSDDSGVFGVIAVQDIVAKVTKTTTR